MPNIASVLKEEISRVARRELRVETDKLKKTGSANRTEISALKQTVRALERQVAELSRAVGKLVPAAPADIVAATPGVRWSAKGFQAQRKRLGLSIADTGVLFGVSQQSVYNWEAGTRPQNKHLPAIVAMKKLNRTDAVQIIEERKAGLQSAG